MRHLTRPLATLAVAAMFVTACGSANDAETQSSAEVTETADTQPADQDEDANDATVADEADADTDATVADDADTDTDATVDDLVVDETDADSDPAADDTDESAADDAGDEPLAVIDTHPDFERAEINDLRRDGDVVTVEFTLVAPEDDDVLYGAIADLSADQLNDGLGVVSGVALVDHTHSNRHLVLRDNEDDCLCTAISTPIAAGNSVQASAQFPAPPEDVTSMSVELPTFVTVDNVPLREVS